MTDRALRRPATLTPAAMESMIAGAQVLERDGFGPKVYLLANGDILKLFRRKRLLSSALIRPHSLRFCNNAIALKRKNIPTVTALRVFRLEDRRWTAVLYCPLPGRTLRSLLHESTADWPALIPKLAHFINRLHCNGVYFRSLHLGNIVETPDGALGLIDISDMQIRRRPLGAELVRRNRQHFEKYVRKERLALDLQALWDYCDRLGRTADSSAD